MLEKRIKFRIQEKQINADPSGSRSGRLASLQSLKHLCMDWTYKQPTEETLRIPGLG
jgi:hypothetical protein